MTDVLAHALFDLLYGTSVACVVGRCSHRRHRLAAQAAAAVVGALILVHLVG